MVAVAVAAERAALLRAAGLMRLSESCPGAKSQSRRRVRSIEIGVVDGDVSTDEGYFFGKLARHGREPQHIQVVDPRAEKERGNRVFWPRKPARDKGWVGHQGARG